jgi:hypothetical protein
MNATRVWVDPFDVDHSRVLVWKNGCFYWASAEKAEKAAWEARLRECVDPANILGPTCQVAPIKALTRVEIAQDGEARLFYNDAQRRPQLIKFSLFADGPELLALVQEQHPTWRLDVRKQNTALAGLKMMGIFTILAVILAVFYFLIAYELIDRAQWMIALVVNLCGPLPLLILAIVLFLFGLVGGAMMMIKPMEVRVLRPAP